MTHETDIPCSDCGAALFDRSIAVRDLPITTAAHGTVTIAACPRCGARYYPEQTLAQLQQGPTDTHRGDS